MSSLRLHQEREFASKREKSKHNQLSEGFRAFSVRHYVIQKWRMRTWQKILDRANQSERIQQELLDEANKMIELQKQKHEDEEKERIRKIEEAEKQRKEAQELRLQQQAEADLNVFHRLSKQQQQQQQQTGTGVKNSVTTSSSSPRGAVAPTTISVNNAKPTKLTSKSLQQIDTKSSSKATSRQQQQQQQQQDIFEDQQGNSLRDDDDAFLDHDGDDELSRQIMKQKQQLLQLQQRQRRQTGGAAGSDNQFDDTCSVGGASSTFAGRSRLVRDANGKEVPSWMQTTKATTLKSKTENPGPVKLVYGSKMAVAAGSILKNNSRPSASPSVAGSASPSPEFTASRIRRGSASSNVSATSASPSALSGKAKPALPTFNKLLSTSQSSLKGGKNLAASSNNLSRINSGNVLNTSGRQQLPLASSSRLNSSADLKKTSSSSSLAADSKNNNNDNKKLQANSNNVSDDHDDDDDEMQQQQQQNQKLKKEETKKSSKKDKKKKKKHHDRSSSSSSASSSSTSSSSSSSSSSSNAQEEEEEENDNDVQEFDENGELIMKENKIKSKKDGKSNRKKDKKDKKSKSKHRNKNKKLDEPAPIRIVVSPRLNSYPRYYAAGVVGNNYGGSVHHADPFNNNFGSQQLPDIMIEQTLANGEISRVSLAASASGVGERGSAMGSRSLLNNMNHSASIRNSDENNASSRNQAARPSFSSATSKPLQAKINKFNRSSLSPGNLNKASPGRSRNGDEGDAAADALTTNENIITFEDGVGSAIDPWLRQVQHPENSNNNNSKNDRTNNTNKTVLAQQHHLQTAKSTAAFNTLASRNKPPMYNNKTNPQPIQHVFSPPKNTQQQNEKTPKQENIASLAGVAAAAATSSSPSRDLKLENISPIGNNPSLQQQQRSAKNQQMDDADVTTKNNNQIKKEEKSKVPIDHQSTMKKIRLTKSDKEVLTPEETEQKKQKEKQAAEATAAAKAKPTSNNTSNPLLRKKSSIPLSPKNGSFGGIAKVESFCLDSSNKRSSVNNSTSLRRTNTSPLAGSLSNNTPRSKSFGDPSIERGINKNKPNSFIRHRQDEDNATVSSSTTGGGFGNNNINIARKNQSDDHLKRSSSLGTQRPSTIFGNKSTTSSANNNNHQNNDHMNRASSFRVTNTNKNNSSRLSQPLNRNTAANTTTNNNKPSSVSTSAANANRRMSTATTGTNATSNNSKMQRSDAGVKKETEIRFVSANVVNIVPADWVDFSAESDHDTRRQHDKNNIIGQFIAAAAPPPPPRGSAPLSSSPYPILNATGEPEHAGHDGGDHHNRHADSDSDGSGSGDEDDGASASGTSASTAQRSAAVRSTATTAKRSLVSSPAKKPTAKSAKDHETASHHSAEHDRTKDKKKNRKQPKLVVAQDIKAEELSEDEQGEAYDYEYWSNECGGPANIDELIEAEKRKGDVERAGARRASTAAESDILKAPSAISSRTSHTAATSGMPRRTPQNISSTSSLLKPTASSAATKDEKPKRKVLLKRTTTTTTPAAAAKQQPNEEPVKEDEQESGKTKLPVEEEPKSPNSELRVQREFINKNGGITTKVWCDDDL